MVHTSVAISWGYSLINLVMIPEQQFENIQVIYLL